MPTVRPAVSVVLLSLASALLAPCPAPAQTPAVGFTASAPAFNPAIPFGAHSSPMRRSR